MTVTTGRRERLLAVHVSLPGYHALASQHRISVLKMENARLVTTQRPPLHKRDNEVLLCWGRWDVTAGLGSDCVELRRPGVMLEAERVEMSPLVIVDVILCSQGVIDK